MLIRSILREVPEMESIFVHKNFSEEQWHWEVRSWFEMSFVTAKFTLLASIQGTQIKPGWSINIFNDTSWICDKLLFLDNSPTNINFIGLMATMAGLLVLCLFSVIGKILTPVKRGLRVVRRTLRKLWGGLLHDLRLAYDCLRTAYEFLGTKSRAVFQAMRGVVGLLTGFVPEIDHRLTAPQSRQSDYDDDDIWNNVSISLGNLDVTN